MFFFPKSTYGGQGIFSQSGFAIPGRQVANAPGLRSSGRSHSLTGYARDL